MAKHTEEEVIKYIKENMIDGDGIMVINKTHPSWIYDYLRHRYKNPEARVEWVREKTGALLWVSGYNTPAVIKQRLRANNLIKIEKVDGKLVERLYSADLSENKIEINTTQDHIYAQKIEKLRKMIKDGANKKGVSAKEYVENEMGIEYINQVMFRSFEDINNWIMRNMGESTNANILRRVDGYNLARDFLRNNWKIQNEMYSSPLVDYMAINFPEFKMNAMIEMEKGDKKQYYFNILYQKYPKRVITKLKTNNRRLYDELKAYRNTLKNGPEMTIKEFIEDYIGDGLFIYVTKNDKKIPSKWTNIDYIHEQLIATYGEGNIENPIIIKLKENRNLEKNIRNYCARNELGRNEFLNPLGYAVDNERQIGNPDDPNTRRANPTHVERGGVRIARSTLERNGEK